MKKSHPGALISPKQRLPLRFFRRIRAIFLWLSLFFPDIAKVKPLPMLSRTQAAVPPTQPRHIQALRTVSKQTCGKGVLAIKGKSATTFGLVSKSALVICTPNVAQINHGNDHAEQKEQHGQG